MADTRCVILEAISVHVQHRRPQSSESHSSQEMAELPAASQGESGLSHLQRSRQTGGTRFLAEIDRKEERKQHPHFRPNISDMIAPFKLGVPIESSTFTTQASTSNCCNLREARSRKERRYVEKWAERVCRHIRSQITQVQLKLLGFTSLSHSPAINNSRGDSLYKPILACPVPSCDTLPSRVDICHSDCINVTLRAAACSLQTPPDRPGCQITSSLENIKETNKLADEHAYRGSGGVNPFSGAPLGRLQTHKDATGRKSY
ncbi:unnamed protein product [Pleuronectes platessa]|uniref:Uncharacterized protein n=1 Tax=Pleuronectes platessa TaxID=8262 RepID=A0A9N7Y5Q4_PLEPL|nr:unnamed protein product [Pleuronectes platessa]